MSFRTKLLASYLVVLCALAALGGWSVWQLERMGAVARRILAENYPSVVAAQAMKESLERQDSAALFALLDRRERADRQLREHRGRFDKAFEKAAHNITEPGEAEVIATIRRGRDEYYRLFDEFVQRLPTVGHERAAEHYFARLEPLFNEVRAHCDGLLRLNQEAMLSKSADAEGTAGRALLMTILLAAALVGAGLGLAVVLANAIVRPVRLLTSATSRIAAGDMDSTVRIRSRDEIGVLARRLQEVAQAKKHLADFMICDVSLV